MPKVIVHYQIVTFFVIDYVTLRRTLFLSTTKNPDPPETRYLAPLRSADFQFTPFNMTERK
ncbi:hypothetical protein GGR21_000254 [Dysgonomonas hofstadii]|uniref:Uncharacterized protein n=1 Tax=Dysgonomonas hofstadii TaxID=637886 RepID=A0A840CI79_9BACT|nr:hypothetical protein [Dysgonomonas hofstadii]MBB4034369.1 hypothetical protein [Dysgonomonas hofstadii]